MTQVQTRTGSMGSARASGASSAADVPRTMLGLLYHATFSAPFRQSVWDDLDQMLRWFEIEDPDFVDACRKVEHAAYLMRRYSRDADVSEPLNHEVARHALEDLNVNVPKMFALALEQAGQQLRAGQLPELPGQAPIENEALLSVVYALVYHAQFRQSFIEQDMQQNFPGEVGAALLWLARALSSGAEEAVSALESVRGVLAHEYETLGWKVCW